MDRLKTLSRIERLEEEILPPTPEPPEFLTIQFLDSKLQVVSTTVLQLGQTRPLGGHWRTDRRSARGGGL